MNQFDALRNLAMQNEGGPKRIRAEPNFHFLAHKAGMQKVDKEKITAVINDASKGSKFYEKQMSKKVKNDQSVQKMKEKITRYQKDPQQIASIKALIEKKLNTVEKERLLNRTWVHVDLDMFFVACEIRDRPELKDKPVAVGGINMISTANYIARQFGVRSAMAGFIAKKLCPELVFVKGNSEKYKETSKKFKNVIAEYDPDYETGGLDEAILDLTGYLNEHGLSKPEEIEKVCHDMRMKINQVTGITCSCGIAPNKMLAKLSSEINKPNGQFYMKPDKEGILSFLSKLPVRKIPGIGSTYEHLLNGLEINTCQDILDRLEEVYVAFTENAFDSFIRAALGISRCYHELPEERKSVSVQRTFAVISKMPEMERKVQEIAEMLAEDLKQYKKKTKHLTLNIKTHNFDVKNKGMLLERYVDESEEIATTCLRLLRELTPLDPLRLIGIKAAQLMDINNLQTLDNLFIKQTTVKRSETFDSKKKSEKEIEKDFLKVPGNQIRSDTTPFPGMYVPTDDEKSKNSVVSAPTEMREEVSNNQEIPQRITKAPQKLGEIFCPICNMLFDSTVNNTRINKHIDKCLAGLGNAPPSDNSTSNVTNITRSESDFELKKDFSNMNLGNSKSSMMEEEKKQNQRKRKPENDTKPLQNELKKPKKNVVPSKTIKLDSFFAKK